ncbi:MAG TPA: exopolysaccharide biosynthesis polyprenyl glycosylphosphotransferase, partial [Thermoanaerobaculia bacterium]|nr:exopolysaccharide biosynthesis polyprenyl glycosylphosphotransferase [Thermoanaerobaculia bacterium]
AGDALPVRSGLPRRWTWRREARALLMVAADVAALAAAGLGAYLLWALPMRNQPLELYLRLWPALPLFLAGYAQAGLYPGTGLGPVETLRRISFVTTLTFLLLAAASFALQLPYLYSRVTFAIAFALALVLVPAVRLVVLWLVARTAWWPESAVVVTDDAARAREVVVSLAKARQLGYAPRGIVWLGERGGEPAELGLPVRAEGDGASERDTVALLATAGAPDAALFDRLQQRYHRVLVVRGFDDLPVEGIRVHNLGGFLGLEYTNNLLDARNRAVKRALDLVLGSLALVVTLPLLALTILAVELRSPGPPFFGQARLARGGRRIRVPKVRTMVPGAEAKLEEEMERNPELRREWQERMKLRNDPRLVPGVGKFLRRFSLDELPQLWSVVRGEMSLVGPRPFPDYHLAQFTPRFLELRQRVRPGITGLWQVTVRSEGPLEQQEALDTYYIRNWSVWLDLYILARTVKAVLGGKGAY